MMSEKKPLLGAILLISGTAIGAGMLAIPIATSFAGFFPSLALLALVWFFFFLTAWFILDVNLSCPGDVNFIGMVSRCLGKGAKAICWITYLLLLYSLTAAYISGSAPLFIQGTAFLTGWTPPNWLAPLPLFFLFGIFVYLGTKSVDRVNRILMMGLVLCYILLVCFLTPHINPTYLLPFKVSSAWSALPILFTSYGFHIIIPTLTTYLNHDKKRLRYAIFIGSLIPFIVYAVWELLILGVVPLEGEHGLQMAWTQGSSSVAPIEYALQNPFITTMANLFSFFAILTSFLGVSLSLSDFLAEGLNMHKFSWGRELACLLTFAPPIFFVYLYPQGFILALQYAGLFVAILLCIFPALMAWKLPQYKSVPRKLLLYAMILIASLVVLSDFIKNYI
jgi:tyrosine-specific transport protein